MHVLLTGLSGAGKTTVGPLLAAKLGRPFVDLDREIERAASLSIAEIFAQQGEAGFRELERDALRALSGWSEAVIALGAGALSAEENFVIAESLGDIVWLSIPPALAAERLRGATDRPLLAGGDAEAHLTALLAARVPVYARAKHIVDARADIDAVVTAIAMAQGTPERVTTVRAQRGNYPVRVFNGDAQRLAIAIAAHAGGARCILVCDRQVRARSEEVAAALASHGVKTHVLAVAAGEELKQLASLESLALALEQLQADRQTVLVAIGGGSLTDAVGFLASCYRRGVGWISMPSTLLGMVDSSLGGKTGVNLGHAKNLLGAFYPPLAVLSDTAWLKSLDAREIRSGIAEMLKLGATHDALYFEALTKLKPGHFSASDPASIDAVARAAAIKAAVVSDDEFELGVRKVLNFGHTFGHAFEAAGDLRVLRHGEAVALGMVAETEFAVQRGQVSPDVLAALTSAMQTLGLQQNWRKFALRAKPFVSHDKKRQQQHVRLAIVPKLGQFTWLDAKVTELERFLEVEGARL